MNNENLSQQLCEICGIKPHYGVYADFGDFSERWELVTDESKDRLISEYRHSYGVKDEDLHNLKPEYYPNFMQPENFVKLLETRVQFLVTIFTELDDIKVSLLNDCIEAANRYPLFAQAIKSQEWAYE